MKNVVYMPGLIIRPVKMKVSILGIKYKQEHYWNDLFLKHIGEVVEVKEIDRDTIEVFKDGRFIARAEAKKLIMLNTSTLLPSV